MGKPEERNAGAEHLMELIDELHRELETETNPDELKKIMDLIDQYRATRDRIQSSWSTRLYGTSEKSVPYIDSKGIECH